MLRESLLAMLLFNTGVRRKPERNWNDWPIRHSRRGVDIAPHLYELWLDALCEAVEEHDPEFTAELGKQWREAMRPGIELIVARY